MSKFLVFLGVFLCLSLTAAAQESTAAFDANSSTNEPASPDGLSPSNREAWQLGVGFQYQHFNTLGQNFHTLGMSTDVTRYLNDWFGVEGATFLGFGHTGTTPNLDAKSFFIGGGPRIVITNRSRFEPWVHVLGGWEHLRFTQTATLGAASKAAFMAGAGVDYKLTDYVLWRVQGDFIGTHFGMPAVDKNYSFGTGLVLNF